MKAIHTGFKFEVSQEDLASIKEAINKWKSNSQVSSDFDGSKLFNYYEAWQQFVDTEWSGWDISEYDNDILCREYLQLAIEYSTPVTKEKLVEIINPIDEKFKNKMHKNAGNKKQYLKSPFNNGPYFWETNTIHPRY